MNDDEKVIPGQVALVDPRGNVLNKGAKSPKYDAAGKRIGPSADFMKGLPNREELVHHMTAAALEIGEKMYEQMAEETATYLEEMERAIFDRVMREIEERSLRGRIKRAWRWITPTKAPQLMVTTASTAAVEAMDPNPSTHGPLQQRKGSGPEGSHRCPTCGEWCVCAEWYDGDRCEHHKPNVDISLNDKST